MSTSKLTVKRPEKLSIQVTEEFDLDKLSNKNQFDYGLLNTEARIVAKQRASEIKSLMHQGTQNIIEIGQKLIEVKEKLEHGQFENWVKVEFDWSLRSARNFMLVARQFKSAKFADLNIEPSALYELAAPSVPEIVRQEILERAGQGEKITYTKAKSVLAHHKPSKPKEAKRVTVDTPSQTVGRESFAESLTVKPALIEEADVDPTRYATPPQNLVTIGNVSEVEVDQDEQDLAEDEEELGQPIKGEQASMYVAGFTLLQQSTQIEESQLGKDAKERNFEVIVQPADTVEVQVVGVAEEVDPEIAGESVQETVTNEYQPEDTQVHDVHLMAADSEAVAEVDDQSEHLATVGIPSSDSKQKNSDARPQTVLYKLYCIIASKTLEYIPESPTLKFSEFDEVARDFTSSTEVTELLEREEVGEFLRILASLPHVNM